MPFWTYMLHCNAGVFYTGQTDDLDRRIVDHKAGRFPGFTRDYLPVELVWSQEFATRDEAKTAEKQIKGWSRAKKLALIRDDWVEISRLSKSKNSPSTSSGQAEIGVSAEMLEALTSIAQAAHPHEACGILTGQGMSISGMIEARNVHPAPATHFEIDPQALIDAHRAERAGGPQVMGYFHSHPSGDACPSEMDRAMSAGDGKVWAIVAAEGVMFWRDDPEGFHALSYDVIGR
ncbi:MAG: Mov34/MPN/PAD-1 family protein [Pseudomonadota bacterium]